MTQETEILIVSDPPGKYVTFTVKKENWKYWFNFARRKFPKANYKVVTSVVRQPLNGTRN